jgi:hypothetical protein
MKTERAYREKITTTLKAEGFLALSVSPIDTRVWPPVGFEIAKVGFFIVVSGAESSRVRVERVLSLPDCAYTLRFQA